MALGTRVTSTPALSQGSQARFEKSINWVLENSLKSFEGRRVVTWCPGFAYQSFDGCQADDAQAK